MLSDMAQCPLSRTCLGTLYSSLNRKVFSHPAITTQKLLICTVPPVRTGAISYTDAVKDTAQASSKMPEMEQNVLHFHSEVFFYFTLSHKVFSNEVNINHYIQLPKLQSVPNVTFSLTLTFYCRL